MKKIQITPSESRALRERFQIGYNYLQQVLAFTKDGPTARKIRRAALQLGGRYVDPDFVPNCRTSYMGGVITQSFADDVVLRINLKTGDLDLRHRGKIVETLNNTTMVVWNSMAIKAQEIAESAMVSR